MNDICCHAIDSMLAARTGSISESQRRRAERHLAGCPNCAEEWLETQRLLEALDPHVSSLTMAEYAFELELGGSDRDVLASHLGRCQACSEELATILVDVQRTGTGSAWRRLGIAAGLVAALGIGLVASTDRAERPERTASVQPGLVDVGRSVFESGFEDGGIGNWVANVQVEQSSEKQQTDLTLEGENR